jgi:hypothetical protein
VGQTAEPGLTVALISVSLLEPAEREPQYCQAVDEALLNKWGTNMHKHIKYTFSKITAWFDFKQNHRKTIRSIPVMRKASMHLPKAHLGYPSEATQSRLKPCTKIKQKA